MLKRILISLILASPAGLLMASAVDDALSTAENLQAKITASSEFSNPSGSNIQNAGPDADSLVAFSKTLAAQLQGLNLGPVSQITSISLNLSGRVTTLHGGYTALTVGTFIQACSDFGGQVNSLKALLPDLINTLMAQKGNAAQAVQTMTQWSPPTQVPGPADPGQARATPTPFPFMNLPTPVPTATSIIPPVGVPTVPPVVNPGTLPGGPSLPPPAPPVATPLPPQATPTPRPLLKAPMAVLSVGGDEGDDDHGSGKVYVANYNMANVAILDTLLKRIIGFIPVGNQPVAMAKGGNLVVVANFGSSSASLIDSAQDAVVATINTGSQPIDVAVTGNKAYVVNQGSNSVTIIDLRLHKVIRNVGVGQQPSRVAIKGDRAYVSDTNDDSVSVIDTGFDSVIATISE